METMKKKPQDELLQANLGMFGKENDTKVKQLEKIASDLKKKKVTPVK